VARLRTKPSATSFASTGLLWERGHRS
jgi:hypothetical protein